MESHYPTQAKRTGLNGAPSICCGYKDIGPAQPFHLASWPVMVFQPRFFQSAAWCTSACTSCSRPVSTSKMKPRTGTSLAIQGCDLTFLICSWVFCSGSLKEKKRIGAGEASPVEALSFEFSSSSVNVVNPQPVWLRSSISVVPNTRVDTTSSPRTSPVTAGPPVRITSRSARGKPKIAGRSESRGSMQVTTTILGPDGSRLLDRRFLHSCGLLLTPCRSCSL